MPSIDLSRYDKKRTIVAKSETGESPFAFLNKEITLGNGELSDKKKESLYMELSSLLQAGIDLKTSFELISADYKQGKDKDVFEKIQSDVLKGAAFSAALQQSGRFSTYEVFSIQIGEETGKLNEVLNDLAKYFQNKIKQQRKIVSALSYPIVVMCTSFGAVFFMLKVVVPMFGEVFKRFGGHLPWITQQIIDISDGLARNFLPFIVLLAILTAFLFSVRKSERFRDIVSKIVLKIPVVGNIVRKIYLARFCNSMRMLISSKVPLLRAIKLSCQMIGYYPIERSLEQVEDDIMKGKSLNQSMASFGIYPSKMIQLIKVGEETNKLDYFFSRIAEQYIAEVEYKTSTLSSMLEPLILIFLGLVVGIILVAMYLPMFDLSNTLQ